MSCCAVECWVWNCLSSHFSLLTIVTQLEVVRLQLLYFTFSKLPEVMTTESSHEHSVVIAEHIFAVMSLLREMNATHMTGIYDWWRNYRWITCCGQYGAAKDVNAWSISGAWKDSVLSTGDIWGKTVVSIIIKQFIDGRLWIFLKWLSEMVMSNRTEQNRTADLPFYVEVLCRKLFSLINCLRYGTVKSRWLLTEDASWSQLWWLKQASWFSFDKHSRLILPPLFCDIAFMRALIDLEKGGISTKIRVDRLCHDTPPLLLCPHVSMARSHNIWCFKSRVEFVIL